MQKLTEVFQPVIDHKIAYHHLVNKINDYRKSVPKWYATEKEMNNMQSEFANQTYKGTFVLSRLKI